MAEATSIHKERLVSVYYAKALGFAELGCSQQALEALKQVNQLKVLEETWGVYPKLIELTEMLQNKKAAAVKAARKESSGGFMSILKSSIGGLFSFGDDSLHGEEDERGESNSGKAVGAKEDAQSTQDTASSA
eukprot:TRINITY_DN8745_c0_g1_i1.p3 TRINITY_DN8745_c0_g1~~TRINITY_DN8745_c0_g1_i1.p3  ORF type:complete len:133 (-),score=40.14 TRINITY_DN8745_c0_g1_i1:127-525(-)